MAAVSGTATRKSRTASFQEGKLSYSSSSSSSSSNSELWPTSVTFLSIGLFSFPGECIPYIFKGELALTAHSNDFSKC
ncbi:hypothetical protein T4D_6060 [Trichinella pseudospiralis]|uniref:Uncharacterized protein n=1 Tax=Trichinella pseudospiralis TaxID=6337 RepID=A0A0V1FRB4_TRIPS|nr:hypothetical protein T4D_6060 [Trichinella pseudospiralis]